MAWLEGDVRTSIISRLLAPRIMLHQLTHTTSAADVFLSELRDGSMQSDRAKFRRNLERLGFVFGMAISQHLEYDETTIQTPLGPSVVKRMKDAPVLATILRAGLPLHHGIAQVFDQADHAYISACRKYDDDQHENFRIGIDAVSSPSLEGRTLILSDPMLATGESMIQVLEAMQEQFGMPSALHVVAAIASKSGAERVLERLPKEAHLWVGDVDPDLTNQGYIFPGLGDAGDLAFGPKVN